MKWCQELNVQNKVDWNKVYIMNYSATIETKLRSFQIKLNLRTIFTNIALCGFGLKISNNCAFCRLSSETLMHFKNMPHSKQLKVFRSIEFGLFIFFCMCECVCVRVFV